MGSDTTMGRSLALRGLVALLLLGLMLVAASPADAQTTAGGDRIVFQSDRDGDNEIYAMNLDGSGVTKLTSNSSQDNYPSWSEGGARVLFSSNRDGDFEVYSMAADGTDVKQHTDNPAIDKQPAYNPISSNIAFVREDAAGDADVLGLDASVVENGTLLTGGANGAMPIAEDPAVDEMHPEFAGDGRMLYDRDNATNGKKELVVLDQNFEGETVLPQANTSPAKSEWDANFSRDGNKILYTLGTGAYSDLWTMNPDGTARTAVAATAQADDHDSAFFPDGSKIAFASVRSGNDEVYTANADGTGLANLTNNPASDEHPEVRPVIGPHSYIKLVENEPEETVTTTTVNATTDDAKVTGSVYSASDAGVGIRNDPSGKTNGLLRLDTSAIPDSHTILGTELLLQVTAATVTDDFAITVDYYDVQGNTTDFSSSQVTGGATAGPGDYTIKNPNITAGDEMVVPLDPSGINKTGITKLRLRMINRGTAPTGTNNVTFAAFEHATKDPATLVVKSDDTAVPDTEKVTVEFGNEPASAAQASGFECKLDSDAWSACVSPRVYTGVPVGPEHTLYVRALDANNNPEANPTSSTWSTVVQASPPILVESNPLTDFFAPVFALVAQLGGPKYVVGAHDHADSLHGPSHFGIGTPETESILARNISRSWQNMTQVRGYAHWMSDLYKDCHLCTNDSTIFAHRGYDIQRGDSTACAYNWARNGGNPGKHCATDKDYDAWRCECRRGNETHTSVNHEKHGGNFTRDESYHKAS